VSELPADKEIKVKWRLINPVILSPVVIIILLTTMFLHPGPHAAIINVVSEYLKMISLYFFPYSIKNIHIGSYLALQIFWFCCYFMSMQPFDLNTRKLGSIVGVIVSVVWIFLVTGAALRN
jgi:hypothetical protein